MTVKGLIDVIRVLAETLEWLSLEGVVLAQCTWEHVLTKLLPHAPTLAYLYLSDL